MSQGAVTPAELYRPRKLHTIADYKDAHYFGVADITADTTVLYQADREINYTIPSST